MRAVFFGTPRWAVPSLRALAASGVEIEAVVTNPDRAAGRGMRMRPSPVKETAEAAGLRVLQPASARSRELHAELEAITTDRGLDVAVVVAYGSILPGDLLALPRLGFVNVHFSLLPSYRGAAPVQRAVIEGAEVTGVSIMVLTEGMDEGPVLAAETLAIDRDDSAGTLGERLADLGAELLVPSLDAYAEGALTPRPQDEGGATYAPKVRTEEARIAWTSGPEQIRNLVRGLNPLPGAWTTLRGRRLKVHRVEVQSGQEQPLEPGELRGEAALIAGTGGAPLEIVEAQIEGRRLMSGAELARGLRLQAGEHLE